MAYRNDIEKELREMDSILADHSKVMPYHLPTDYFEDFASQVTHAANSDSSGLSNTAMPFDVPSNYFESLPQQVIDKTQQVHKVKKTNTSIWQSMRWAAAALLVIAIGIGSYQTLTPQSINIQDELSGIPETDITEYIQDNIDDFDAELLASNIASIETDFTEVNEDAIESYLEVSEWQ